MRSLPQKRFNFIGQSVPTLLTSTASQLIGEREVVRISESQTRNRPLPFTGERSHSSTTQSEHRVTESAVMASEIEALPDRSGYLKFASVPAWMKVEFPIYDVALLQTAFVAG